MNTDNNIKRFSGFSLIELMVAMLIGLIVLNGVIRLVINSKRSFLDNQAISQIQENARFSVDILSRELKIAGYIGCMPISNGDIDIQGLANKQAGLLVDGAGNFSAVEIFDQVTQGGANLPEQIRSDVKTGTDVLIVRHTDPDKEWLLATDLVTAGGTVNIQPDKALAKGAPIALVSQDCSLASLAQISDANESGVTVVNAAGALPISSFKKGSRVTPVVAYAYYIGESSVIENVPALKRERLTVTNGAITSRSDELAVGVSDLQLAVSSIGADGSVGFEDFAGVANDALAVRVYLTMRSHKPVNPPTEDDPGYVEKVAVATVRIRNQG